MAVKQSHSPPASPPSSTTDPKIFEEAANWIVKFQSGDINQHDQQAFERWRMQSAAHRAAWRQIESVLKTFKQVTPEIGHSTLQRAGQFDRRRMIKALGFVVMAAPTAWLTHRLLPWESWMADIRTATGEQKTIDMADGTRLVLNTASAADIFMNRDERRVHLQRGEIFVTTGRDPAATYRPFIVQTQQGTVRALGTQFSVRRFNEYTRVAVLQDEVEIRPRQAQAVTLHAGQQIDYRFDGTQLLQPIEVATASWRQGMFIAQHMRLADIVEELSRYRSGVMRCHPDVADIPVSGAFPLLDTDASLALLEKTLPLRIGGIGRYWVTIEPDVRKRD